MSETIYEARITALGIPPGCRKERKIFKTWKVPALEITETIRIMVRNWLDKNFKSWDEATIFVRQMIHEDGCTTMTVDDPEIEERLYPQLDMSEVTGKEQSQ